MTETSSPRTLGDALERLRRDPSLLPIAGCTDLMVAGSAPPPDRPVLDLLAIRELKGIREADDGVEVGATTTFSHLRSSPLIRRRYPALAEAAAVIGGWQIQNRATLGGNIVNASPAGDSLPVLLAFEAELVVAGPGGTRTIPYRDFHVGYRETALEPGELLVRVRLPPLFGCRQRFVKVGTRRAQAISKLVLAQVARLEDGRVAGYRLAAGSLGPTPLRLGAVERSVQGRAPDRETAAEAGRAAAAEVEPIDDVRSTAVYRRVVLERLVRRLVLDLEGEER